MPASQRMSWVRSSNWPMLAGGQGLLAGCVQAEDLGAVVGQGQADADPGQRQAGAGSGAVEGQCSVRRNKPRPSRVKAAMPKVWAMIQRGEAKATAPARETSSLNGRSAG